MKTKEVKKKEPQSFQQVQTEPQNLKVELTVQEWEEVLAVIENSTSAHIQVKSVAAELVKQLQPQVKDDK